MKRPRILLADDHQLLAEGLKELLAGEFDVVGLAMDGRAMIAEACRLRPDVIVADITMPNLNGIEALVELRKYDPRVKVVFLTMHQDAAYATRALEAGASGFVLKHAAPTELIGAIHGALKDQTYIAPSLAARVLDAAKRGSSRGEDAFESLTHRQREILQLLAEGRSAKQVGMELNISARTVEFHKYRMMEFLHLTNSAELIHCAIKWGLVTV